MSSHTTGASVIPDSHHDLLERPIVAHMATVRADGSPQTNPIWFEWDGAHIKVSGLRTRQKTRNIEHEPRVAFSITDPDNPYRYLEVRGVVERVEDDADYSFIDSLSQRYMGKHPYPWHQPGDERVTSYVRPVKTSSMG
jgi:PPOX class probable F420-dependent enzyme